MFGGQRKVPMLNGQWKEKEKEKPFSPLPTFPQQILLKPSFFPLISRFYFTMVLCHYLGISFFFLDL
jgi:hypothetical protein